MIRDGIIVRIDIYPNGEIIPLGVTDLNGNTKYIDKVIKKEYTAQGERFFCVSKGDAFVLICKQGLWSVE